MSDTAKCPFCGMDDFDLIGLKAHLTGEMMFSSGCKAFADTLSIEEENRLRKIKRDKQIFEATDLKDLL